MLPNICFLLDLLQWRKIPKIKNMYRMVVKLDWFFCHYCNLHHWRQTKWAGRNGEFSNGIFIVIVLSHTSGGAAEGQNRWCRHTSEQTLLSLFGISPRATDEFLPHPAIIHCYLELDGGGKRGGGGEGLLGSLKLQFHPESQETDEHSFLKTSSPDIPDPSVACWDPPLAIHPFWVMWLTVNENIDKKKKS